MKQIYHTAQWVGFPVAMVFAFFADPDNLPCLMPGWQDVRLEKSTYVRPREDLRAVGAETLQQCTRNTCATDTAGPGSTVVVSFRPVPFLPLRLTCEVRIVEFVWNEFFCDQQVRGPFDSWRHCHRTREEIRDGVIGTLLTDELEYELPFGSLGSILNALVVRKQIEDLFAYRHKRLPELLRDGGYPCP
jgi:ligand-binding SRPBCC domain-containing protein